VRRFKNKTDGKVIEVDGDGRKIYQALFDHEYDEAHGTVNRLNNNNWVEIVGDCETRLELDGYMSIGKTMDKVIVNPVTGSLIPIRDHVEGSSESPVKDVWSRVPMICTLVFPIKKSGAWAEFVLLGMKNRGFGNNRYNGFGGKIRPDEDMTACVVRELKEECGLIARPSSIRYRGTLHFISCDNQDATVFVFVCDDFSGELRETEEMTPKWFDIKNIPYDQMWPDDRHWLPSVLGGKEVSGYFAFKDENTISHFSLSIGRLDE